MRRLVDAYDALIVSLAKLAAAALAFSTIAIVVDVVSRNVGLPPLQWTSAVIEYLMLFATMAGAPWLVRLGGHVSVDAFTAQLPPAWRRGLGRVVAGMCAGIAGLLSWRALALGIEAYERGTVDIRSIDLPASLLYFMIGIGFLLAGIEFLRPGRAPSEAPGSGGASL